LPGLSNKAEKEVTQEAIPYRIIGMHKDSSYS